jgi:hypothetical protein
MLPMVFLATSTKTGRFPSIRGVAFLQAAPQPPHLKTSVNGRSRLSSLTFVSGTHNIKS